jgi:phenylpropionate dioxygenase-like ring-hydroxylating dioxygenase large terminal subunit
MLEAVLETSPFQDTVKCLPWICQMQRQQASAGVAWMPAVENLADPGHVPFTHHATVSKRSSSSVIDLEVTRRGSDGFDGRWAAGPRQGTMG